MRGGVSTGSARGRDVWTCGRRVVSASVDTRRVLPLAPGNAALGAGQRGCHHALNGGPTRSHASHSARGGGESERALTSAQVAGTAETSCCPAQARLPSPAESPSSAAMVLPLGLRTTASAPPRPVESPASSDSSTGVPNAGAGRPQPCPCAERQPGGEDAMLRGSAEEKQPLTGQHSRARACAGDLLRCDDEHPRLRCRLRAPHQSSRRACCGRPPHAQPRAAVRLCGVPRWLGA